MNEPRRSRFNSAKAPDAASPRWNLTAVEMRTYREQGLVRPKLKLDDALVAEMRCVAIARALMWSRKVLIMDEPTAALGVRETGKVLDLIRTLKSHGLSVVLVMHNI